MFSSAPNDAISSWRKERPDSFALTMQKFREFKPMSKPNPPPRTSSEPTAVFNNAKLIEFGLWLLRKGNRESTVQRKLKYLKGLKGSIDYMVSQVLAKDWSDKSKECALEAVRQYAEFQGLNA